MRPDSRRRGSPPRSGEWLLRALLGPREPSTDFIVGDLREEHAAVRARRGRWPADAWYLFEIVRIGVRGRWERRRDVTSPRRAGGFMRSELRQAARFLGRRPAFSGAIVLTVALAIAATTLAFAVVDGVLLEPLPYATPERLVVVWEHNVPRARETNVASPANFMTWRDELRSFDRLAALVEASTTVRVDGEPERVGIVQASAAFFEIVGAQPLVGRLYGAEEDRPGGPEVVVLSEGYWRRRFGADPAIVGRALSFGSAGAPEDAAVVLGVLPERFNYAPRATFGGIGSRDVWTPPQFGDEARQSSGRFLEVIGRLAPGVTVASAQREASALATRLAEVFPDRQSGWDVNVVGMRDDLVGDVRATILIVFGAVVFVLLIACANVANLLMTRATERQQEMAVRSALGAGRARLVRQQLAESLLLSTMGAAVGLPLAWWGVRWLVRSAPDLPRLDAVGLDATVIGFALFATLTTALLFGLAPALHLAGADVAGWLKERATAGRRSAQRIRGALVVAQVALSLVLLIGAGLLVRSLINRMDVGVGFDTERLLTAELNLPSSAYPGADRKSLFYEQLVERVQAIPGVQAASAIIFAPLAGPGSGTSIWAMDRPVPEAGQLPVADIRWIHHDYHATMGIRVLEGRTFEEADRADAPLAVVISEAGAKELWPNESALGKRIAMPWGDTLRAQVVGVVADVRHNGPDTEVRAMLYFDHRQHRPFNQMTLVVRTRGEAGDVVPALRTLLRDLDPALPLYNVRSMESLFANALARSRFTTSSLGLFAALALILAAIGIYGVMAYATQQRSQEIGIRMALGADRGSVVRMVVLRGMALVGVALGIGAVGAFGLSRLLGSLVFGVSTTDPTTFIAMLAVLGATGFAACWLPARRASGISPASAIRYE